MPRASTAAATGSPEPMMGRGGDMCGSRASASEAAPANRASSRARSETEPTTSPAVIGGSAPTMGIWETPYSRRMSMASRTVSFGCACTSEGVSPDLVRSTSATDDAPAASTNP